VIAGLGLLVACAIALPHVLRLERVAPAIAIALWSSALILRALVVGFLALWLALYVPHTPAFDTVTQWEVALPLFATGPAVDGHRIGDLTTSLPTFLVAVTALVVVVNVARGAFALWRALSREALGSGPDGSLILPGTDVLVAVAGFVRPRVVVSAGALVALDDEELAASLAHERGHIARRHRFLLAACEVAWRVPGTRGGRASLPPGA
jgi:Zn-dependent protease with chaperone function